MKKEINGILIQRNGKYIARIYYYVDGKRKSKDYSTGIMVDASTARKVKAQSKQADLFLADKLNNFVVINQTKTTNKDQLFTETIMNWLAKKHGVNAESTLAGEVYYVKDIVFYFETYNPVKTIELTSADIEKYLAWERERRQPGYTGPYARKPKYADGSGIENSVMHRATAIRSALTYAKRNGIVDRNVASKRDSWIDLPRLQQHKFPVLAEDDAKKMLQLLAMEELWFRVAVLLALLLGLRRSEIIGLRIEDINWESRTIIVCNTVTQQKTNGKHVCTARPFVKNRKAKVFTLSEEFAQMLADMVQEQKQYRESFGKDYDTKWEGYLMRHPDGKLIKPNLLTNTFSRFAQKTELPSSRLHDLRHSCASILYASGVDLLTIQEILGHSQLSTTLMYTHNANDKKDKAVHHMAKRFLGNVDSEEKKDG